MVNYGEQWTTMVNYGFDGRYITNQNFSQGAKGRPDGSDPS
jgi:hypothetical protein